MNCFQMSSPATLQSVLGLPGSLDVFPNSVTYSAAISSCEKGDQWQQALDLFVAEESVELLPDVITCNASPGHQLSPHKSGQGLFSQPASKPNRRLTRLFCPCLASELLHVLMFACSQSASQPASQPASHRNNRHTHICTYIHM